jgi:hypothetical protein
MKKKMSKTNIIKFKNGNKIIAEESPEKIEGLENVFAPEILNLMNNLCECGHPLPLSFQLLHVTGKRNYICPKCKKDNTPPTYDDDVCEYCGCDGSCHDD